MRRTFQRKVFQNHVVEENLENVVLQIKPKYDALDLQEKLANESADTQAKMLVKLQRKELNDQIKELAIKFGVSYSDIYARLQGEKTKLDILDQREKNQKRIQQGQNDDDLVDLVDEQNVLVKRIKNISQLPIELKPAYERYLRANKGIHVNDDYFDTDEAKEEAKILDGYYKKEKLEHYDRQPKLIIPMKSTAGRLEPDYEHRRAREYQKQMENMEEQKQLRNQLDAEVQKLLIGRKKEDAKTLAARWKRQRQEFKSHQQQAEQPFRQAEKKQIGKIIEKVKNTGLNLIGAEKAIKSDFKKKQEKHKEMYDRQEYEIDKKEKKEEKYQKYLKQKKINDEGQLSSGMTNITEQLKNLKQYTPGGESESYKSQQSVKFSFINKNKLGSEKQKKIYNKFENSQDITEKLNYAKKLIYQQLDDKTINQSKFDELREYLEQQEQKTEEESKSQLHPNSQYSVQIGPRDAAQVDILITAGKKQKENLRHLLMEILKNEGVVDYILNAKVKDQRRKRFSNMVYII